MRAERRVFTAEERAQIVERYRSWEGSQWAFARTVGVTQCTVSRWARGRCKRRSRAAGEREGASERWSLSTSSSPAPTLLEVIPTVSSFAETAPGAVRLLLGDGVSLVFDTLPPASWVAELAAELRRC